MKNIQNIDAYQKVILIFVARHPPPLKTVVSSHKCFFPVFSKNTAFFPKNLFYNKTSVT